MIYPVFVSGLISILTPAAFSVFLISIFLFISIFKTPKAYFRLLLALEFGLVICFYCSAIYLHNPEEMTLTTLSFISSLKSIAFYLLTFSLIGLSKVLESVCSDKVNNLIHNISSCAAVFSISILFFIKTSSGLGPILGSLMITETSTENIFLEPIIAYSVGVLIPIFLLGTIIYFTILKLKQKKWFNKLQIISCLATFISLSYLTFFV